jgi:hypothetical protein
MDESKIYDSTALCGNTVDVKQPDGALTKINFGGFISLKPDNLCLVQNITGYNAGESPYIGDWVEYSHNDLLLARRSGDSVFLIVEWKSLVKVGVAYEEEQTKRPSNVFSIGNKKE